MDSSFLAPTGEYFEKGLSNGRASRDLVEWMGIDDFAVFNPYCHHETSPRFVNPQHTFGERILVDYRLDYEKPLSGPGLP